MSLFSQTVYRLVKRVPRGMVTTYKEIAKAINTKAYRAVGQALKRNPSAPIIPCHRVVKSDGSIGGFNGQINGKKIKTKINLLKKEGVKIKKEKVLDFNKILYRYT